MQQRNVTGAGPGDGDFLGGGQARGETRAEGLEAQVEQEEGATEPELCWNSQNSQVEGTTTGRPLEKAENIGGKAQRAVGTGTTCPGLFRPCPMA